MSALIGWAAWGILISIVLGAVIWIPLTLDWLDRFKRPEASE
jgi:hypothetical protein